MSCRRSMRSLESAERFITGSDGAGPRESSRAAADAHVDTQSTPNPHPLRRSTGGHGYGLRSRAQGDPFMPNSKITDDPRIDPRIKAVFGAFDPAIETADIDSREQ